MRVQFPNKQGDILIGDVHNPKSEYCIVICHGLASSRKAKLHTTLFAHFKDKDRAVFKFDFSGNGESSGEFSQSTVEKQITDLRAALRFLEREYGYEKFVTIGHSFGGAIVLLQAAEDHRVIGTVSLAGVLDGLEVFKSRPEKFHAGSPMLDWVPQECRNPEHDYVLSHEWMDSALAIDITEHYPDQPVLIIHGTEDTSVPIEQSENFPGKVLKRLNTAHNFKDKENDVGPIISEFLEKHI